MHSMSFQFLTLSIAGLMILQNITFYSGSANASGNRAAKSTQSQPIIVKVSLKGKKLMVTGENFSGGEVIVVNDAAQKTNNDTDSPTTLLIAPKAGKKFSRSEIIKVEVRGADGSLSSPYFFYTGITVFPDDRTITLRPGEQFALVLAGLPYQCDLSFSNPSIVRKVVEKQNNVDSQVIIEALQPGQSTITAICEIPCSTPPCPGAPTRAYNLTVIVQP